MKLAILNITAGGLSGGYRKYLDSIIPCLLAAREVSGLLVAVPEKAGSDYWRTKYPSVEWVYLKPNPWSLSGIDRSEKKKIVDFLPDVLFIPTARFWKLNDIPVVNMVRNMEPLVSVNGDNNFLRKMRLAAQFWVTKYAVLRACRTIAVSKYVRQFLITKWSISKDKVGVVYHGCSTENGTRQEGGRPLALPDSIKAGRFLFTVGSICPYRGLEDIIETLSVLKTKNTDIPELVIAGKVEPLTNNYKDNLLKLIYKNGISGKIHWVGELDSRALEWCYANCSIFLMASRVEACPNIALEAMSYGCVCISTRHPPMPEIFKNCAIYYNAGDGDELAYAIDSALKLGNNSRADISRKAQARAAEFSWDSTIKGLIAEFKTAIKLNIGKK